MLQSNAVKGLIVGFFSFSFLFGLSFALTESIDLFGQTNSVDLVLNDIWIVPSNPREGEEVMVYGSVYNSGIIASGEVSDAVTVGYIVNGELLEINLLENIMPGVENGIVISSGPLFDAVPGNYVVTVVINFHDTLSHLRDNQENNIVQKQFQIGNQIPSIIEYNIFQEFNKEKNEQIVTIQGKVRNSLNEISKEQIIGVNIDGVEETIISNKTGEFFLSKNIPFKNKSISTTLHLKEDFSFIEKSQTIFPLKLEKGKSVLNIQIPSMLEDDEKSDIILVIFQDSYDNLFKKISVGNEDDQNFWVDESFLTFLPGDREYIIEIYLEGRLLTAFQEFFQSNQIIEKEIQLPDSAEIRFRVVDELGEPQSNVVINNWIYSGTTDISGFTDWIEVLPTINEEYIAKATFEDESIKWSKPFFVESNERKVIQIFKEEGRN